MAPFGTTGRHYTGQGPPVKGFSRRKKYRSVLWDPDPAADAAACPPTGVSGKKEPCPAHRDRRGGRSPNRASRSPSKPHGGTTGEDLPATPAPGESPVAGTSRGSASANRSDSHASCVASPARAFLAGEPLAAHASCEFGPLGAGLAGRCRRGVNSDGPAAQPARRSTSRHAAPRVRDGSPGLRTRRGEGPGIRGRASPRGRSRAGPAPGTPSGGRRPRSGRRHGSGTHRSRDIGTPSR